MNSVFYVRIMKDTLVFLFFNKGGEQMTINQRLDLIKPKILEPSFRIGRGLANEINFWIFDYDAEDEMAVRSHIDYLYQSINAEYNDVRIVKRDFFTIILQLLNESGYLEQVLTFEKEEGSNFMIQHIRDSVSITEKGDSEMLNKITEGIDTDKDIIFLTGVGKAWPIIRSHTVLNNLHSRIDKTPVIMFFPGIYENELKLFSEITDDNYYRAFKLIER